MHKPITLADIEEMKRRGCEPVALEKAREDYELGQAAQELCAVVEAAFAGVTLGDGVGLRQGNGKDDWEDAVTLAALRAEDEKEDWRALSSEVLNKYNWALTYFDPEGMRFHLPAFLICDLKGEFKFGMEDCLTGYMNLGGTDRFSLLTPGQRKAVRQFLQLILRDRDYEFDWPHLARALEDYWVENWTVYQAEVE